MNSSRKMKEKEMQSKKGEGAPSFILHDASKDPKYSLIWVTYQRDKIFITTL